jgi:uncharacterized protein
MNKKKQYNIIFSRIILAVLLITMILPIRALASDRLWDSDTMPSTRQKPRLLDNADLLTDSEEEQLLAKLDETSQKWQCNIVLLTVDDHTGEIQDFADNYFDYNGFQADYGGSGILFMLSMADREWAISTSGKAIDVFTDYGQAYMVNAMMDDLGYGDYFGAFKTYVKECDKLLDEASKGTPYDVNSKPIRTASDYMSYALYSVIIGLLLALAPILKMKADLKTVKMNSGARNYSAGGPTIRARDDRFLHKTLHKTPRPQDNDSHSSGRGGSFGGGSSVHVSSSGSSHGGSHGHF